MLHGVNGVLDQLRLTNFTTLYFNGIRYPLVLCCCTLRLVREMVITHALRCTTENDNKHDGIELLAMGHVSSLLFDTPHLTVPKDRSSHHPSPRVSLSPTASLPRHLHSSTGRITISRSPSSPLSSASASYHPPQKAAVPNPFSPHQPPARPAHPARRRHSPSAAPFAPRPRAAP